MNQWDQCSLCGKPTTAGLVCYACAAKLVEEQKKAGAKHDSWKVDGVWILRPKVVKWQRRCPRCDRVLDLEGKAPRCLSCGYKEDEE
jgi:hypothetical protein